MAQASLNRRRIRPEADQGDGQPEFIAATSCEAVLALLAPEKAASFKSAQRGEEGIVTHTTSEGRWVRALRDEQ